MEVSVQREPLPLYLGLPCFIFSDDPVSLTWPKFLLLPPGGFATCKHTRHEVLFSLLVHIVGFVVWARLTTCGVILV